ncbi:MAG TPA: 4-alpha-glucanotransferase [Mycobacteriales bacterium]
MPDATEVSPALAELARAHRVATSYEDWAGEQVAVSPATVTTVLAGLGVDASTPERIAEALAERAEAPWRRLLPPTVVVRGDADVREVVVHAPAGVPVTLTVEREDGTEVSAGAGRQGDRRTVDGAEHVAVTFGLPELPYGWHRLTAATPATTGTAVLVVAPTRVERSDVERAWGWMVQLYSIRSGGDWGLGDYADLAELARWSGAELGAGVLLCNPLHAVSPVVPVEPSPYYPSSRRFRGPLYLRVEQTPEYAAAPPELRAQVDALRPETAPDRIDRDTVWTAKLAALELLWPLARRDELRAYRAEQGEGLADFALFSALAERYGVPWQDWPAELRRPDAPAVRELAAELADRAEFHAWLQWLCDEQLAVAGAAARDAGMTVGIVHDLAVGVDPGGADAWGLQDVLAMDMTVGAPPDSFNQQGQDWRLPPWNPERLAEAGYAPYRDMLRAVLRSAGGVRIDHVMGLFRLWWIPAGASAADGTYVYYDDEALLGVLALEAYRAGALVVGEDLGTVEPRVSRTLAERNILGSAVLWFERDDDGAPLPPEKWREQVMASVTTHDLPTAAGFLADEHVRVRAELGQLGHSEAEERARVAKERDELLAMLRENGLLGPDPDPAEIVRAMHAVLARAPSRLVLAALGDAVGDLRQPNLPGTVDQYPNWRLPVADGTGRPVRLEELRSDLQVRRLAQLLAGVGDR